MENGSGSPRTGGSGLGHARLSIIDLVTGDQPIASEDEPAAHRRQRRVLRLRAHSARARSGGPSPSHALRQRDRAAPLRGSRARSACISSAGEFAFALWDEAQQRLFAARDRFGIKPLFFAQHDGALYLASEVKALFAAGVPARWNREGLFNHHVMGGQPTETLFEGV